MGNEFTELEKTVVRLETQLAMISETFLGGILRLEKKLDEREQNYVTKDVLHEKMTRIAEKHDSLQDSITEIHKERQSNKNNLPVWLGILPSIAAVIVAIIAVYK